MSLGRAMGEWLGDTLEGAELLATQLERARAAPKAAIREMHAFALGLADETGALMEQVMAKGKADRASVPALAGASARAATLTPPSSNTGGKVPKRAQQKRGGVA